MIVKKIITTIAILCLTHLSINAQDGWSIKADTIDPNKYFGVTVANGMIGIVSSPKPLEVKEVILGGVYDTYNRGRVSNFLPSFNLLNMKLSLAGRRVSEKSISNFKQDLNMKEAMFNGSFDLEDIAHVSYSYCALRHLPHTVLMEVKVEMKKDGRMYVENLLETPASLQDQQNYFNQIDKSHVHIPLLTSVAKSPTGKVDIAASTSYIFEEEKVEQPTVIHKMNDSHLHLSQFKKDLKANETYSFTVVGTLISSVQNADPYNQAERSTIYACLEGKEKLLEGHKNAWSQLWESDIEIEGDDLAQQDIRSMLYHLYSFGRENSDYSPSPMGLSGLGYNGHVFWDTELFMFPPMLLLQPKLAESMIEYRYRRLHAAKQNATIYGYKGAMFPWESAASGTEETPVWALTGPFEHHITADVGIAAWNYYLVTQDMKWLETKGWELLSETATFWQSRVTKNDKGEYEIKNVVAADEWAENVDNNAFTNAAAKVNLESAVKCAKLLKVGYPKEWEEIAKNIPIRQLPDGTTREHDSYTGQKIKQADVNLLAYPLRVITDNKQIEKDLAYCKVRVPQKGTPAMTQAIFALLYSRLGDGKEAYDWYKDAFHLNVLPPFRVIAENKGDTNPYFATGAGGILQSVIMGFGGLEIDDTKGGLKQLKSTLPPHWKRVVIKGVGKNKAAYTVTQK